MENICIRLVDSEFSNHIENGKRERIFAGGKLWVKTDALRILYQIINL